MQPGALINGGGLTQVEPPPVQPHMAYVYACPAGDLPGQAGGMLSVVVLCTVLYFAKTIAETCGVPRHAQQPVVRLYRWIAAVCAVQGTVTVREWAVWVVRILSEM